jgi:predicted nuclease with TOPRIM domain
MFPVNSISFEQDTVLQWLKDNGFLDIGEEDTDYLIRVHKSIAELIKLLDVKNEVRLEELEEEIKDLEFTVSDYEVLEEDRDKLQDNVDSFRSNNEELESQVKDMEREVLTYRAAINKLDNE